MRLFGYDRLVMVHPNDGEPRNQNYIKNLAEIVTQCNIQEIPIYKLEDGRINQEIDTLLLDAIPILTGEDEIIIGKHTGEEAINIYQRTANKIATRIRKNHLEINLGFGGTNADQCVYATAIMLCKNVHTNQGINRRFKKYQNYLSKPIKQATILNEIT